MISEYWPSIIMVVIGLIAFFIGYLDWLPQKITNALGVAAIVGGIAFPIVESLPFSSTQPIVLIVSDSSNSERIEGATVTVIEGNHSSKDETASDGQITISVSSDSPSVELIIDKPSYEPIRIIHPTDSTLLEVELVPNSLASITATPTLALTGLVPTTTDTAEPTLTPESRTEKASNSTPTAIPTQNTTVNTPLEPTSTESSEPTRVATSTSGSSNPPPSTAIPTATSSPTPTATSTSLPTSTSSPTNTSTPTPETRQTLITQETFDGSEVWLTSGTRTNTTNLRDGTNSACSQQNGSSSAQANWVGFYLERIEVNPNDTFKLSFDYELINAIEFHVKLRLRNANGSIINDDMRLPGIETIGGTQGWFPASSQVLSLENADVAYVDILLWHGVTTQNVNTPASMICIDNINFERIP